jgi:hypothetical protein
MLLRVFESMLGLPGGFLVPEDRAANRSLTTAEAELVRLLNEEFSRRDWPSCATWTPGAWPGCWPGAAGSGC